GTEITTHLFNYALKSMISDSDTSPRDSLQELNATRLQLSSSKPAVTAKTNGQLRYLKALETFDVVFGIGPAGTGKTYLAMAKALSLLKEREVDRVILTRPAVEAGEALGF